MTAAVDEALVLTERIGQVQLITMNAPARLNAIDTPMVEALKDAISDAEADLEVGAIVLTGAGRGFCSGATLSPGGALVETRDRVGANLRAVVNPLVMRIHDSPLPVVAAVNGPAAGAGFGIAMAADIILASETATFTLAFVRIGASLDAGVSQSVKDAIGPARAKALALLGDTIDADQAGAWGLVWKVLPPGRLLDEALTIAARLARGPREAQTLIKRLVNDSGSGRTGLVGALASEADAQALAFKTADFVEGVAAFQQKRKPQFGQNG